MKIITKRTDLLDAAAWASRAIGKIPILMALRLEVAESGASLSAFDYDTALTARVDGSVGEIGAALVPAAAFVAYLKAQRAEAVTVQTDGSKVIVEAGRSRSEFASGPLDDYPRLPEVKGEPVGTVRAEVLEDALTRLMPVAGSRDDIAIRWRDGLLITADQDRGEIRFSAAISPRMGQLAYRAQLGPLSVLVPAYSLEQATKGMRGDVEVYDTGGILGLSTEDRTAVVRLMDVTLWPNLDRVMNAAPPDRIMIDRDELLAGLRSIRTSSDRVWVDVEPDEVRLTTYAPTKGDRLSDVTEVITCETAGRGSLLASIEHFSVCLRGLDEGPVQINCQLSQPKPAVLSNGRGRFVFMPLRVRS